MIQIDHNTIWEKMTTGVFVIAEAGKAFIQTKERQPVKVYLENAKQLVDKAVWAGADAIKWQTHFAEDEQLQREIESPHFVGADRYQWILRNEQDTPYETFWKPLKEYSDSKNIVFMTTPMSRGAALRVKDLKPSLWKIGSGDILDFVCMDFLRDTGVPIIMSSGMSSLEEVKAGIEFLLEKNDRVMLMHALSKYPGEAEEANLATIQLYREIFPEVPIGFSENSVGIDPTCIAVALGVTAVEKHFTISRDVWGADHKVSSTPEEFKEMVETIKKITSDPSEREQWLTHPKFEDIVGVKEKIVQEDEKVFRPLFRKSLMAGDDIPVGTVITEEMIYAMRPQQFAGGLPSEAYPNILGKRVIKKLKKFDPITNDVIE